MAISPCFQRGADDPALASLKSGMVAAIASIILITGLSAGGYSLASLAVMLKSALLHAMVG